MQTRGEALVLIGFGGSGKSSAGRELARRMRCARFDTDEMVVDKFEMPIAEIFARHGEEEFRQAETEALDQISTATPCVVVTGGGLLLREQNQKLVRAFGKIVQLRANEETLFRRISRRKSRPLLQTADPRATLAELMRTRQPIYDAMADWTLDTTDCTHPEVADKILRWWNEMR